MAFEVTPFSTDYPGSAGGGRAFVLGENKAIDTFQSNLKETMADIAKKRAQSAKEIADLDVDMSKVWDADTPYFSKELAGFRNKAADFYKWSYSNPNQYGTEEYFKKYNDLKKETDRLRLEADMSAMQKDPWTKANQEYVTKQDDYDEQSLADQAKYRGMNIYQRQAALAGATDPLTGKVEPVKLLTQSYKYDYNAMVKATAENIGDVQMQTDNGVTKVFQLNPYFSKDGTLNNYGKKAYEQGIALVGEDQKFQLYVKAKNREAQKAGIEPLAEEQLKDAFVTDVLKAKDNQWKQDVIAPKDDNNKPKTYGNKYVNGNAVATYTARSNPSGKTNESPILERYVFNATDSNGNIKQLDNADWSYVYINPASKKQENKSVVGRFSSIDTDPRSGVLVGTILTNDLSAIEQQNPTKYQQELDKIKKAERKNITYEPIVEVKIPLNPQSVNWNYMVNRYGFTPHDVRRDITGSLEVPTEQYTGTGTKTRKEVAKKAGEAPKAPTGDSVYNTLDAKTKAAIDAIIKKAPGKYGSKDEAYQAAMEYFKQKK